MDSGPSEDPTLTTDLSVSIRPSPTAERESYTGGTEGGGRRIGGRGVPWVRREREETM